MAERIEQLKNGKVASISCNLDDMTAEDIGYAMELLLSEGALDVYWMAIGMKKNRPGVLLTCICRTEDEENMAYLLLKHTTTLGVRVEYMHRYTLERRFRSIETGMGTVRVKESFGPGISKEKMEFEDLKRMASEHGYSIRDIRNILEKEKYGELSGKN